MRLTSRSRWGRTPAGACLLRAAQPCGLHAACMWADPVAPGRAAGAPNRSLLLWRLAPTHGHVPQVNLRGVALSIKHAARAMKRNEPGPPSAGGRGRGGAALPTLGFANPGQRAALHATHPASPCISAPDRQACPAAASSPRPRWPATWSTAPRPAPETPSSSPLGTVSAKCGRRRT